MKKQTLIMIHGFRGTHHGLKLIARELREHTLIVPDIPGFGKGAHLKSYTLDAYINWLHAFIQKQQLVHKPILLGHSFGSIITAAYAARYPDTLQKLILVNPIGAPALEGPKAGLTKLAIAYYKIGKWLPAPLARGWLSSPPSVMVMSMTMAKTKDKTVRKYIHGQHLQYFSRFHSAQSVHEAFVTSVSHNVAEFAPDIKTQTLLIAGDQDDITPIEVQRQLVSRFKHAQLAEIKAVGHLTHYETPKEVASAIQAFIKSS